jgi:hypothetical protein
VKVDRRDDSLVDHGNTDGEDSVGWQLTLHFPRKALHCEEDILHGIAFLLCLRSSRLSRLDDLDIPISTQTIDIQMALSISVARMEEARLGDLDIIPQTESLPSLLSHYSTYQP